MTAQAQKKYPAIKGLTWHRDAFYSFFIPNNWQRLQWSDGRVGVIYAPNPDDPLTVFAVGLQNLGMSITSDDLETLAEGYFETVEQLPEVDLTLRNQKATGKLLELEAKYTFSEQGQTRKRWSRIFYHETHQIAMTAQGASVEKYDYWLPWFFEAMMTAKIHSSKPQSVSET